jgi:threonine dehydrogenase-like Zn-dependent dehydrogenase
VIDAVGVDAEPALHGPAAKESAKYAKEYSEELSRIAPKTHPQGELWRPGRGPSQVLRWAVDAVANVGTISIIGVYPQSARSFPIGAAMNKNLTLRMGNCNHRRYIPKLVELVRVGAIDPTKFVTQREPLQTAIAAYQSFDLRREGWLKVELLPSAGC